MRWADGVHVTKNVLIPMRDGVRLAADLYRPEPGSGPPEPLPVVMEYIPYRKDEVVRGSRFYEYLPRNGYIVARVDIRGTGASEGANTDEYVLQEQLDGYDAIEWLAAQPLCDGHVNLMGISYGGFTVAPGRHARAAAPDEHHPDVLHRRPLHRRLPLPRRPPAEVLRRRSLRQLHDRLQRPAALPGVVGRRLGDGSGRSTSRATSRTC